VPERTKQKAVLNFILIMPGNTLLKTGISKNHPIKTRQLAAIVKRLATLLMCLMLIFINIKTNIPSHKSSLCSKNQVLIR